MSSSLQGLAPREGLECLLVKMGRTGPLAEPHRRLASLGTPVPRTPTVAPGSRLARAWLHGEAKGHVQRATGPNSPRP